MIMFSFAALVLVTFSIQVQGGPEFCHERACPAFTVTENNPEFEERLYDASIWISTKLPSTGKADLMDGYYRLKDYCESHEIPTDTWPALINITEGEDGSEEDVTLSWFVAPDTVVAATDTDSDITLKVIPQATVYVSVFGGLPNHDRGKSNAEKLRVALRAAGKSFEETRYIGAGYENPMNIFISHRNEIWIYAST